MPIFIYQCPKCQYQSEELVMPGEPIPKKRCPKCKKTAMEKRPTTVSLKGKQACSSCSITNCLTCDKS